MLHTIMIIYYVYIFCTDTFCRKQHTYLSQTPNKTHKRGSSCLLSVHFLLTVLWGDLGGSQLLKQNMVLLFKVVTLSRSALSKSECNKFHVFTYTVWAQHCSTPVYPMQCYNQQYLWQGLKWKPGRSLWHLRETLFLCRKGSSPILKGQ